MKNRAATGFTLIELMVALSIVAILIGIAAPNMSVYAKNYRLTSAANDLLAAIHAARSTAGKGAVPTTMCFTTDANPSSGQPDCAGNGTQGWITWVDTDADSVVDTTEEIIVRHAALPSGISVVTQPASTSKFVAYGANGFSKSVTNALSGIVLCDERKNIAVSGTQSAARGLMLSTTGRPNITRSVSTIATSANLLNSASSGTCVP